MRVPVQTTLVTKDVSTGVSPPSNGGVTLGADNVVPEAPSCARQAANQLPLSLGIDGRKNY